MCDATGNIKPDYEQRQANTGTENRRTGNFYEGVWNGRLYLFRVSLPFYLVSTRQEGIAPSINWSFVWHLICVTRLSVFVLKYVRKSVVFAQEAFCMKSWSIWSRRSSEFLLMLIWRTASLLSKSYSILILLCISLNIYAGNIARTLTKSKH